MIGQPLICEPILVLFMFSQMDRIRGDFDAMWHGLSEEQRELYGRRYIDHHLKVVESAIPTASFNLTPVIDAITNALLGHRPKTRYLVSGGGGLYDIYRVNTWHGFVLINFIIFCSDAIKSNRSIEICAHLSNICG